MFSHGRCSESPAAFVGCRAAWQPASLICRAGCRSNHRTNWAGGQWRTTEYHMGMKWQLVCREGQNQPTAVLWIRESYKNLLLCNKEFTKINIQCFYSNLIYFFFLKPSLPVAENEENKCVHKVRQSVNLWNILAMRFAICRSFKLQKRGKGGKNKTQGWPPLQRRYSISMSFFHFTLMNNSGWPTHRWAVVEKGDGDTENDGGVCGGSCPF